MIRIVDGSEGVRQAAAAGDWVIIVDALRASATLSVLCQQTVPSIHVCGNLEAAEAIKKSKPDLIATGEWHNAVPDWFDYDNSPQTLLNEQLPESGFLFLSTNGARLLMAAEAAPRVFCASTVNASAMVAVCRERPAGTVISIAAAGHLDNACDEDTASAVVVADAIGPEIDPQQEELHMQWKATISASSLEQIFLESTHGKELQQRGKEDDVRLCAQADILSAVPEVSGYETVAGHSICTLRSAAIDM